MKPNLSKDRFVSQDRTPHEPRSAHGDRITTSASGAVKNVRTAIPDPVTQSQVSSSVKRPANVTKKNAGTNKHSFHGTHEKLQYSRHSGKRRFRSHTRMRTATRQHKVNIAMYLTKNGEMLNAVTQ